MDKVCVTYFPELNNTVSVWKATSIIEKEFDEFDLTSLSDMLVPNTGHDEDWE